jgi:pimeloyl-ACP methyl ester carboxylesterase
MLKFNYADSAYGQVHYAKVGTGPSLVLLPGSSRSYTQFLPLIPYLKHHFEIIAVDTLGFGASAPFPANGDFNTLAQGVLDLLDALKIEKTHVFGMHTGHKVAAALASEWPDRVDRVIFAGKSHSIIPDQNKRNNAILERIIGRTFISDLSKTKSGIGLGEWAKSFKSISQIWWHDELFKQSASEQFIDNIRHRVIDELTAMPSTGPIYAANFLFDFEKAASQVKAKTLIIEVTHPSEDASYGRQAQALCDLMPDAQFVELPSVDEVGLGCNADPQDMAQHMINFLRAN